MSGSGKIRKEREQKGRKGPVVLSWCPSLGVLTSNPKKRNKTRSINKEGREEERVSSDGRYSWRAGATGWRSCMRWTSSGGNLANLRGNWSKGQKDHVLTNQGDKLSV